MLGDPHWRTLRTFISKRATHYDAHIPAVKDSVKQLDTFNRLPSDQQIELIRTVVEQIPIYATIFEGKATQHLESTTVAIIFQMAKELEGWHTRNLQPS